MEPLQSNEELIVCSTEQFHDADTAEWAVQLFGVYVMVVPIILILGNVGAVFRKFETLKTTVNIGAIFPPNTVTEVAFASALARASMESERYHFVMKAVYSPFGDSFTASKAACELLSSGVIAVFGPTDPVSAAAVEAHCRAARVPHIQAVWRPPPVRGLEQPTPPGINLYPEAVALSKAVALFIADSDWRSYTLLYDDDHGLIRLQEILKHTDPDLKWLVRRLVPGEDNRPLLKALKSTGETRVILDCPADRVLEYLRQANEVKFFEDYMSYVLMSLDAHTLDLEELRYGLSNVTCLRIFDHSDPRTRSYLADWIARGTNNVKIPRQSHEITVEAALASDAARLITDAVENSPEEFKIEAQEISCDSEDQWEVGEEFTNHLLTNPIAGITNMINLDNITGERLNFNVEIMELSNSGFNSIAKWNPETGFNYVRTADETSDRLAEKWQNKTFKVVSRIGAPYLVEVTPKEGEVLTGNDRYEGYSKDLIHEILKEILHLNYEIEIVPGNGYGSYNKETKKWDGLVGHLLERKADLAICDLTITYERRSSVDFTTPFMTLGISILYLKPTPPEPELFSFLKPFSVDVWIYMAAAYLMVSLLLHILARLAPNDWENPHPCDKSPEELENIWHIKNSCWLTMGSIMTQGSDILPKGYSTRWVCGMWWFFALIMCSSYTANLAAFLTNAAMDDSIKSAEDLGMQTKIKYGTLKGGSTYSFFKRSNVSLYQRMYGAMESARPSVFVKNNDEGLDRVLKGKRDYAYFMESTAIEYQLERHCDLMQVGGLLDSKGYGIAMPFDSSYRTAVDNALLKLAESGKLVEIKNRWWKAPPENACVSEEAAEEGAAGELGVENVGGVFVVLACGCSAATAMGIFEFLWNVREVAIEQKMTQSEALWAELTFALSFWETEKPVKHSRPSSPDSGTDRASRASSVLRSAADLFHLNVFNK
uniref:SFRICE_012305 n=1 Tax=Spodoptera frugiperda TaxID=7108 RepID=A0A2H1W6P8_SPOFR